MNNFFKLKFNGINYNCLYITSKEEARKALARLKEKYSGTLFGIDTETMALPKYKNVKDGALFPNLSTIRLLQISTENSSIVFDLLKIEDTSIFIEFLETEKFIAHYALFDLQFLMLLGVKNIDIGCTMLMAKLIYHAKHPYDTYSASLAALIESVFGVKVLKSNQASDWSKELTFEQIEYAALDSIEVRELAKKLVVLLNKYGLLNSYKLLKDAQHPIASMQLNGISFNVPAHRVLLEFWRDELVDAKNEVLKLTGLKTITNNTLASYLEENLDKETLSLWPRTEKTGKIQTDANAFADFSYLPIVAPLARHQKLDKLCSSFGLNLIQRLCPKTGRLHPKYNMVQARTGRLSSDGQQFPRDPDFRSLFVAPKGKYIVLADYSQVEVRACAEVSGDKAMLQAFEKGEDIYKVTAARMNHKTISEVTKEERQLAKCLVLGLQFGLGAKKLGHYAKKGYGVEITPEESQSHVENYRAVYPEFRAWQLEQVENTEKNNFVVWTINGKRRKLDPDNYYGASLNHPIQGSCAEALLFSLCYLYEMIKNRTDIKLIGCVHDEILLEVDEGSEEKAKVLLEDSMTMGYKKIFPSGKTVKNLVEATKGRSWAECKN